jgi:hypothetical protein
MKKFTLITMSKPLDFRTSRLFQLSLFCMVVLLFVQMQAFAGDRGRPHISNTEFGFNRLLTDMNTSLRGVSLSWDGGDNADQSTPVNMPTQAQLDAFSKTYGLNCIHVYLEMDGPIGPGGTERQVVGHNATLCDSLVNMASRANLYVIITIGCGNHNGMIYDLDWSLEFWNFYAPRYANRTHVIYESHNEPGPYNPAAWSTSDWNNQVTLYDTIRALAPNTHILTCSFMSFNTGTAALNGISYMQSHGVDFSNASVAFHGYETMASVEACITQFQTASGGTTPALLCTEFDPQTTNSGFNNMIESHHIGWVEFIFLQANDADMSGFFKPAMDNNYVIWAPDYGKWPNPNLIVKPNTFNVSFSGGIKTSSLTAKEGWTAVANQPWLSITPASGDTNAILSITIQPNTGTVARSGTITITGNDTTYKTITVSQAFEDGNLAFGKPVTVSSSESSAYIAGNAVDGNLTTRWASTFSDPQWIKIDLQATYTINKVVLKWEAAAGKSYQIQVSTDNTNWTNIYSTTTGAGGSETLNITGTGRYIRMYGTARKTTYGYSLFEFQVFGIATEIRETKSSKFEVYPVPFTDIVTLKFNNNTYNTVTIINLSGETVLKQSIETYATEMNLNVSLLRKGAYFLALEGTGVRMSKLVIK